MDWVEKKPYFTSFLKKYRWAVLVLLAGLLLMALPEKKKTPAEQTQLSQTVCQENDLQRELEELLSQLDGAGKVKVLLSPASGKQTYYQVNDSISTKADSSERRKETVIVSGSDRSQSAVVQRIDPPVYLGAVVLCQGGNSPQVRLAVVNAVAAATGLTSDKISVGKMK